MKPVISLRYLLPAGLFILAASFILTRWVTMPDFANGFSKGIGIGILILAIIYKMRYEQTAR